MASASFFQPDASKAKLLRVRIELLRTKVLGKNHTSRLKVQANKILSGFQNNLAERKIRWQAKNANTAVMN